MWCNCKQGVVGQSSVDVTHPEPKWHRKQGLKQLSIVHRKYRNTAAIANIPVIPIQVSAKLKSAMAFLLEGAP